jgi:hypothetical protein
MCYYRTVVFNLRNPFGQRKKKLWNTFDPIKMFGEFLCFVGPFMPCRIVDSILRNKRCFVSRLLRGKQITNGLGSGLELDLFSDVVPLSIKPVIG